MRRKKIIWCLCYVLRVRKLFEVLKQALVEGFSLFTYDISLKLFLTEQSDNEANKLIEILHFLLVRIDAVKISYLCIKLPNKQLGYRINSM